MINPPKPKQILGSSKELALGLIESIAALAYICAKLTRRASHKLASGTFKHNKLKRISCFRNMNASSRKHEFDETSFGQDGLWRKSILMGDKCEPLDFSGVIYYDSNGNMLPETPRKSPRSVASPYLGYGNYETTRT